MPSVIAFDIETNGLLDELTTAHCLTTVDLSTGEEHAFRKDSIEDGLKLLSSADQIAAHNAYAFDIPALRKLYPTWQVDDSKVIDTIVFAGLVSPKDTLIGKDTAKVSHPRKLIGSHKLEAWGHRLGMHKGDYAEECKKQGIDPWAAWSQDMEDYCLQDSRVCAKLLSHCIAKGYAPAAVAMEMEVARVIRQMEFNGINFDVAKAGKLLAVLSPEREITKQKLIAVFGEWYGPDGKEVVPKKTMKRLGFQYTEGCPYQKIKLIEFNPASRAHVAGRLRVRYGWQPSEFTESGQPKVDETVMSKLPYPEASLLTRYFLLEKRIGQIAEGKEAWLKSIKKDGRIHGRVDTLGAVTRRATHSRPNISQVPKVGSLFGKECRELFIPAPGWVMVGADLAGLELRLMGHYLAKYDGGAYGRAVIEGSQEQGTDVHSLTAAAIGLDPKGLYMVGGKQTTGRNLAKTFLYALIYGAGDKKLGRILGKKPAAGKAARQKLLSGIKGMGALVRKVQLAHETQGWLPALDGGRIPTRSSHSALNTLFQSAGAVAAKKWIVASHRALAAAGYISGRDYRLLIWAHDELQYETRPEIADAVGSILVSAAVTAGEQLGLRVPLAAEYKVGDSWAATH